MPGIICIRYLTAAFFALVSSAALAQIDGAGGERLQIQLRIPEGKAAFKGADPVTIDFILTNPTSEKVQVLVWRTPFAREGVTENIFDVAAGRTGAAAGSGRSQIGYIGPLIKRRPPGPDDFITLAPGESRTTSVNLADYYAIYQQGDYSVTYRAAPAHLPPIAGGATPAAGPLRKIAAPSNAVTFSVTEARTPAPKLAGPSTGSRIRAELRSMHCNPGERPQARCSGGAKDSCSRAANPQEHAPGQTAERAEVQDVVWRT
jgi:hypothetical protein